MFATRTILSAIQVPEPGSDATDAELLRRFAESRDEAAFEALVRRHARLVWGVCRRTLSTREDAEDAFQAAFLVLARGPDKLRRWGSTAAFLFGVARRVALKLRSRSIARVPRGCPPSQVDRGNPVAETALRELQGILDDEIARLPEDYRLPFVMCVLDGESRASAATNLGVNLGTLSARLARARLLLRERLARRGIQLPAALGVLDLSAAASALPLHLVRSTLAAAVSGPARAAVSELAAPARAGVVPKLSGLLVLCAAMCVIIASQASTEDSTQSPLQPIAKTTAEGDSDVLLPGAVARLGSMRWRHEGEAHSLSFSPDGKALAVLSGESGTITVFETATGKALHRLIAPAATIAYSPDGTVLATQLASGAVQLWDARSLKPAGMLRPTDSEPIFPGSRAPIAFSPDGKFLAATTGGPAVTIWDVSSGKVSATLTGHNHSNPAMAFSPDDRVVYLGASRTELQVWDANTGKYLRGIKTEQSSFSIAVSEDGNFVASGGRDRIIVADTRSGKELSRLELPKLGAVLDVAFTPDAKTLLSWTEDGKVRVWDLATRKERLVLDSRGWLGRSMAVSRDGKLAAAGTVYNVVRVWEVATGKEMSIQADGHDAPIHSVAFAPDGKTLVTGGANRHIHVWDASTGRQVRQLTGQSASQVSFSPDGKRMASTWLWNKHARIWDMDRGVELCQLAHDSADEVHAIGFSPNGKTMVSASWKRGDDPKTRGYGFVQSWDASNGKSLKRFELQESHPTTLAVSPRGDLAAVGGWGEAPLHLCDLQRSRARVLPLDRFDAVKAVAFSPDGRLLASGGIDRENVVTNKLIHRRVVVWEVLSGRPILKLAGHERTISALAFVPGGRVLASADGGDNFNTPLPGKRSIRFWDMRTGKELTRIEGHESDITSLAFSPDGKKFVCGLHDGTALIWETPPVALTPPEANAGRKLGPRELAGLWEDLTRADPQVPYEAIQILAASPDQSVPFLASVLHPVAKIDMGKVRKWIADLGSEDFAVREAGSKALSQYGDEIGPELRKALAADPSPEVRRRLQALLAAPWPPVRRQELRAVWVLELIGTPAARKLLESLANGEPDAALTREARRACSSLRTAR